MTDLEIAHATPLLPIRDVAAQIGIDENDLEQHGKYIAKVPLRLIDETQAHKSRLILVTSISATRAGIGKTTVSIGLALGLNRIGRKTVVALREPSLGPCFGMKGGAAGGGHAQVLPMEKINLHFTGDFHAITAAHVPARARRNRGAWWCTWVPASFPAGVPAVGAVPREAFRSCVSVSSMPTPSRRVIVPAGYRQTN